MSQALALQVQQEAKKRAQNGDLTHRAVRTLADHELPTGTHDRPPPAHLGHEFSWASVRDQRGAGGP